MMQQQQSPTPLSNKTLQKTPIDTLRQIWITRTYLQHEWLWDHPLAGDELQTNWVCQVIDTYSYNSKAIASIMYLRDSGMILRYIYTPKWTCFVVVVAFFWYSLRRWLGALVSLLVS